MMVRNERNMEQGRMLTLLRCSSMLLLGVPVRKLDGVRNERNMEWGRMLTLLRCSSMLLLGSQSGSLMG